MAKAKIRKSLSEQQKDQILLAAYNQAGFRTEVTRQLRRTTAEPLKQKAQGYVNDAIDTIKQNLKDGLGQSGTIQGAGVSYSYFFNDLAKSTKARKKGREGDGSFWLDWGSKKPEKYGISLSDAVAKVNTPTVHYRTKVVGLERRKGPDRIDFEISLKISEMPYPLDDMVRRPLLSGREAEAADMTQEHQGVLSILSHLEFGFTHFKAGYVAGRPWISGFSAEVGNVMFEDLTTNR